MVLFLSVLNNVTFSKWAIPNCLEQKKMNNLKSKYW